MFTTCSECGYVYDDSRKDRVADHRQEHERQLVGLPIDTENRLRVERASRPLHATLALVHAIAGGDDVLRRIAWDTSMFAAGAEGTKTMFDGGEHDIAAEARAIIAVAQTPAQLYVVGLLVTRRVTHRTRVRWCTDQVAAGRVIVDEKWPELMNCCEPVASPEMIADPAMSIEHVWVHRAYRRQGIARRLVEEAVDMHDIDIDSGITWKHPFLTSAGASLAYQFNADQLWLS